ncbi:hypothetical protein JTB14_030597 [Gonioctena quinquepunctata]|nr:hypothetical protein JTB14_030597 [Gonioctena quinquepunctata]
MNRLVIFVFLYACTSSCSGQKRLDFPPDVVDNHPAWALIPNDICGTTRPTPNYRIIGGEEATLGQFPWLARLGQYVQHEGHQYTVFTCAGALITKYYVLTAAHCDTEYKIVRLGENTVGGVNCDSMGCAPPPQDIPIGKYFVHNFSNETSHDDLMLIELKSPAVFTDFVRPVCLPRGKFLTMDLKGRNFKIAGWGKTDYNSNQLSDVLMYIRAPLIDDSECNALFTNKLVDTSTALDIREVGIHVLETLEVR